MAYAGATLVQQVFHIPRLEREPRYIITARRTI